MIRHLNTLVLPVAMVVLAGCTHEPAALTQKTVRTVVKDATAHEEPINDTYSASGTVRGRNTTVLTSKTTGYVRAVLVRSGDHVVSGQSVVQLETSDVQATVARVRAAHSHAMAAKVEAESSLDAAKVNVKAAKSAFERETSLFRSESISQQQYDDAEARWRSAVAQERMAQARVRAGESSIEEAKAALGEAQATLSYATIVVPFSGRVLERRVDPGALATPGTPLLVISQEDALRVEVAVEATRANNVSVGDPVDLEIDTLPRPIEGTIGEIVPSVDVGSRAFLVKIDLPPSSGPLRPGTFARVGFHIGVKPRLVVPTTAITFFGALARVFVTDDSQAHLRMITIGETYGVWTEVLSGLSSNEHVIVMPSSSLRDGSPVEVQL